jgi:hypothetical protein
MKGSTSLKGIHSIKSIQSIRKDADENSKNPNFLKLYMLEKERTRLQKEKKGMHLRLEPIDARLKEISEYYSASLGKRTQSGSDKNQGTSPDDEKPEWKTVGINY